MKYYLAIDIGASSGRHILGSIQNGKIVLEEIHRFDNIQILKDGHDSWDIDMLFSSVIEGIKKCSLLGKIPQSIAIDTWGVDYVLLDGDNNPLGNAVAYRDSRTKGMKEKLEKIIPFDTLYEKTGIQYQPYNTVYQLMAQMEENPDEIKNAKHFLMMPEFLSFLLTDKIANEYTNASTTALINAKTKTWDEDILNAIGIPKDIFKAPSMPKTFLGYLKGDIAKEVGFNAKVILCASHDTASAFMAVPAKNDTSVYISSGTWSLLGVENTEALTNEDSRNANFTNEGGYEYRFRYLKNIMGLWMIQSIRREVNGVSYVKGKGSEAIEKKNIGFPELIAEAKKCADFPSVIDVDSEVFLSPESMIEAIKTECERTGQRVPESLGEIMQCVYQSLSKRYKEAIKQLEALTNKKYTHINIVGGGCQDTYLNDLTAQKTGLEVVTGPIEGTALGNLMAQFIADNEIATLSEGRELIRKSFDIK